VGATVRARCSILLQLPATPAGLDSSRDARRGPSYYLTEAFTWLGEPTEAFPLFRLTCVLEPCFRAATIAF